MGTTKLSGIEDRDRIRVGGTCMSVTQIESAVRTLPRAELLAFAKWFEEYFDDAWDREIERDANAGRLEVAAKRADEQFEAGQCSAI